jgi:Fis family transcriptional regulator
VCENPSYKSRNHEQDAARNRRKSQLKSSADPAYAPVNNMECTMSEKIAISENLDTITLRQAVKDTLRNYFANIGSEQPVDFYSILLEEIERPLLETLINHTHYNQVKMANILGISRGTLRKKLKQYGMLD